MWPVHERISEDQIGEQAHLLGQVVGLALRRGLSCPIELNLMPKKVLREKQLKKRQPMIVGGCICRISGLAGLVCFFLQDERVDGTTGGAVAHKR